MPRARVPTVVLCSAPGTLHGVDARLHEAGVRLIRLTSVEPRPVDPRHWLGIAARAPTPDTLVVTSRVAVEAGVRPWHRATGRFPRGLEVWAVGPGTATALRSAGLRRVRRPPALGAEAIARALARPSPRWVLHFRSDRAGPRLPRLLRRQGHRVIDLVVYHIGPPPRWTSASRRQLLRADLLVVTSPSGLSALDRQLGRRAFTRLSRAAPLVVLGERSRRAARRHGFRRVSVAPSTAPYRFSRYLLRELDDARS
jgi:uroporphyrinogen-III synthase